jgi:DNA-binding transcriptional MerR regulator
LLVWNEAREEGKMQDIARMLRRQGMPAKEIREILITNDGELIRRHLELHRERLDERLADERRAVADLERDLIEAAAPPCPTA